MPYKLRTTFYSLTLAFAVFVTIIGFLSGNLSQFSFSPRLLAFGNIAGGVSLVAWIWISILLSLNNRPTSTHFLTRASVHFSSFVLFVPIFIALGIIMLTQTPIVCNFSRPSDGEAEGWCGTSAAAGTLSLITAILSAITAIIIWTGSSNVTAHVCSGDAACPEAKEPLTRTA